MRAFKHVDAKTVAEAATAKAAGGAILAGGTDLLTLEKDFALPKSADTMVNIKTIPNLSYIKDEGGLKIGALTTITDIVESTVVKSKWASLAESALKVGTPQLRNQGTLGGNLCQQCRCWYYRGFQNYFNCFRKGGALCFATVGDNRFNAILGGQVCFAVCPSDTAIALTALGATFTSNTRTAAPIKDLFVVLGTSLAANEIVTEIQVPAPATGTKQAFKKYALRKSWDFAIASAAVSVTISGGNVTSCTIAMGGVAPTPWRATAAEDALKGGPLNETTAAAAAAKATTGAVSLAKNAYMVPIAKAMVRRALLAAV
jgi:xanthine dehydrogenase YagS FAD-binding subunit